MPSVSELNNGVTYNLFKDNVKPAWEDPENANGGRLMFTIDRKFSNLISQIWLYSVNFKKKSYFVTILLMLFRFWVLLVTLYPMLISFVV